VQPDISKNIKINLRLMMIKFIYYYIKKSHKLSNYCLKIMC